MEKPKKEQAEKLQIKLDKLLQTKEKKQLAFDKAKKDLSAVSKDIDVVKLKLFEILQNGSSDVEFSSWAKRRINESGKSENANSSNPQKPTSLNHSPQPSNNSSKHIGQNHHKPQEQNQANG